MAIAGLLLAACSKTEVVPDPVRPVITQTVTPGAASPRDIYSGELRARYETDLAFRVGGKLVARPVDAGARVAKGQVLARLDPEDARLASQAAQAQLASADSDLALARSELDRNADLLAKGFISQSAFDAKKNVHASAQARSQAARSQSSLSSNQASYTTLVADADGVVVSTAAEPGQVLSAGQAVLRLARAGEKEVVVNAPEGQLARFKVGQEVSIALWSDAAHPFPGRIREIAGGADPATRTYAVKVAALGVPESAQLGMTASVVLGGGADANLVLLPLGALAGNEASPAVWVLDTKSQRVHLRPVKVAQLREDGVAIASGLAAGEVVVTAGVHKLREDQLVRRAAPL
jgi:RND family efflux transporter MFP subunit